MDRCLLLVLALTTGLAAAVEDAPVVMEHHPYTHELTIENPYDRAIRVAEIEATCTCSDIKLGSHFLLPFASTTLSFTTPNENQSGLQQHQVWLMPANPGLTPLNLPFTWSVQPNVAVDLVHAGATAKRPDDRNYRDIYAFRFWLKPSEIVERLKPGGADSKRLRVWSPASSRPDGTPLTIESIDYDGKVFAFKHKRIDDNTLLLLIHGADTAGSVATGKLKEKIVIHTNHPHKPTVELTVHVAIDPGAGDRGAVDPFGSLR